jgi:hypothetical protein
VLRAALGDESAAAVVLLTPATLGRVANRIPPEYSERVSEH